MNDDNSDINSDFNSDVIKERWFTVNELSELALPGYPRSARRLHDRAKSEGWKSRQVPSQGRKGMRTEYAPPTEVLVLIDTKRIATKILENTLVKVRKEQMEGERIQLSASGYPSSEWLILVTMIVSDADWLPDHLKKDMEARRKLTLTLFGFLTRYLGSSDAKWHWMMEHKDILEAALRFVYGNDQMYADLEKDTSESNNISKPVNKS